MSTFSKFTDDELLLLITQGKVGAFEEVYERYWAKLYNSAHKRLDNHAICEEVVQDVFVKFWEKRFQINVSSALSSYLYTAVKYSVIDYYRRELLKNTFLTDKRSQSPLDNSNEENIFLYDLKKHIERVVESLPEKCRKVYQLSRNENKTNKEIAVLLNISEKTVEGHLTIALKSIKASLCIVLIFINAYLENYFF
ncbi:hypothetical protein ASU31_00780 [Pedobacter ginsenosidimutans]|uniref:RNA polymerase subunit sigma-24 n=1 Tax=Pedobacter ginsenosidimutans TaxID=687842 RepID=A0A0T5VWB2_9SPHI|nr:RNA polymerase sigma-70 factor [Pedobacter ginsenosidimutans]KRT17860.1 hypothetical protein ASU31_00780 [Pedobacter ginsenosidimutans]